MNSKRKNYIPNPRHNPEVQARRIDRLSKDVAQLNKVLKSVTTSYDRHMEHLSAFAKHDMGNAVQSMYAILKILEKKLQPEDSLALKTSIDNMQNALDSFENMVPYSRTNSFPLKKLMAALESLTRFQVGAQGIIYRFIYDRESNLPINQPYQALLQLLQNLTSNSIKSFKECNGDKLLEVEAVVNNNLCTIRVKDTGCGIKDEDAKHVFDYKFTTTDGCGIGLYHAQYVCEQIGGTITFDRNTDGFSTIFTLTFNTDGCQADFNNR